MLILRLWQFYFKMNLVVQLRRNHLIVDCCQWLEVFPMCLNHPKHFFQQSLQVQNLPLFPLQLGKLIQFYLLRLVQLLVKIFHHYVRLLEHLLEMAGLLTQNVDLILMFLDLCGLRPHEDQLLHMIPFKLILGPLKLVLSISQL